MLATQARANPRHLVQSKQGGENYFDVPVLSSDDDSSPSETSLDDACEAIFDHTTKALEACILAKRPVERLGNRRPLEQLGNRRALPFNTLGNVIRVVRVPRAENEGTEGWPNGIRDIQHNPSPARLCHATGEFEGVIGGVVGRRFVEIDAKVFTKKCQGRPPGGHRAHVGTIHGTEAG